MQSPEEIFCSLPAASAFGINRQISLDQLKQIITDAQAYGQPIYEHHMTERTGDWSYVSEYLYPYYKAGWRLVSLISNGINRWILVLERPIKISAKSAPISG